MIVQGIMTAQLPWTMVFIGVALAFFCFLVDVPILAVALGIYLPMSLTAGVFAGGIVRALVERTTKSTANDDAVDKGILLASGLIAGDALFGIVVASFAALGTDIAFGTRILGATISGSSVFPFVMFLLLAVFMYWYSLSKARSK